MTASIPDSPTVDDDSGRFVNGVEIVHWNPVRYSSRKLSTRFKRVPYRVNNFGDLLGPVIVGKVVEERLGPTGRDTGVPAQKRLLSIGSIIHQAADGDVVWGSGVSGKHSDKWYRFSSLDVRAVRGPVTAEFLRARGISVGEVTGDPGLLVGRYFDRKDFIGHPSTDVLVAPNLNDIEHGIWPSGFLDPRTPLRDCLRRIASAELVVGSSLHAIVVAESWGIPARLVTSTVESTVKYDDYYRGSGRTDYRPATSVDEAIALGGEPGHTADLDALVEAFPVDLWSRG